MGTAQPPSYSRRNAFVIPTGATERDVFGSLAGLYTVRPDRTRETRCAFFDSFDWRLYFQGRLLYRSGGAYTVSDLQMEGTFQRLECPEAEPLRFWWEFPESPLRSYLRSVLGPRALIPRGDLLLKRRMYRILDGNAKTVLRAAIESSELQNGGGGVAGPKVLFLAALRGYDEPRDRVMGKLLEGGFVPPADSYAAVLLRRNGTTPGDCSSELSISLSPATRTVDAVCRILPAFYGVVRRNEDGIRRNLDVEFLHDYRVSLRRARSLLAQIKKVFPRTALEKVRGDLKSLAQRSNEVRDLDVVLLRRAAAWRELVSFMDSEEYRERFARLQGFLREPPWSGECVNAGLPIVQTAGRAIRKSYRKILESRDVISSNAPPERIHRLRISCKKLRYLLEFFVSLYPQRRTDSLVRRLKKLQNYLGAYNDYTQQIGLVRRYLATLSPEDSVALHAATAGGGLLTQLHHRREDLRGMIGPALARFCSSRTRSEFDALFRRGKAWRLEAGGPGA